MCQRETSEMSQMLWRTSVIHIMIITIISYTLFYDEVSSWSILFIYIAEHFTFTSSWEFQVFFSHAAAAAS